MGNVSNLQLKTVEARRYQKLDGRAMQLRIDNNLSITSLAPSGENTATVEFNYTASYGPLGVIKIDGEFHFQDVAVPAALGEWQTKRQMPGALASQLHTTIMQACVPEAVLLARSIQLPPPIPLPQVQFQRQEPAKGRTDMDPAVS
jgi:hypothetical protein